MSTRQKPRRATRAVVDQRAQTDTAQRAFLQAFVERGTVLGAAEAAGIHRDTHYDWLKTDPTYAANFAMAEEEAVQMLETEIRRRAMVGTDEPVFHGGKVVGHIKKYSDNLAMFILKARRPDMYRDRFEGTVKTEIDITDATDEEIATVKALMQRQALKKATRP